MGSGADTSSTEPFHLSHRRGVTSDREQYHELSYKRLAFSRILRVIEHIIVELNAAQMRATSKQMALSYALSAVLVRRDSLHWQTGTEGSYEAGETP